MILIWTLTTLNSTLKERKANVKGSLRRKLEHRHRIGSNPYVTDTIENSSKVLFFTTPSSKFFHNSQSALQNANFVTCTL